MNIIYFFVCLGFLIPLSIIDIKKKEVGNYQILLLLLIGVLLNALDGYILPTLVAVSVMFVVSFTLWKFAGLGGADSKIMMAIFPFFFITSFIQIFAYLTVFLVSISLLTAPYVIVYKLFSKKKKIAFIPCIALAYVTTFIVSSVFAF